MFQYFGVRDLDAHGPDTMHKALMPGVSMRNESLVRRRGVALLEFEQRLVSNQS